MTFIIAHNFGISDQNYYVRVNFDGTFSEVYDPSFATTFNSKGEAMSWIQTNSPFGKHSSVVDREAEIPVFEEWKSQGLPRRTLNCVNNSMSRPYNNESLEEVIRWWVWAQNPEFDGEIRQEDYQTWPSLYQVSEHLWGIEYYCDRESEECDCTVEIYTNKDGKFSEFEKELKMVLDLVTLTEGDYLVFPVFDHCLSEGGNSVRLLYSPATGKALVEGRWESNEFSNLEEAFEYLRENRYYGSGYVEDEDFED